MVVVKVIDVQHVCKHYGAVGAVKDLSFGVAGASCFGLLGPNGAGKTTMMKMIYAKALRDAAPASVLTVFGYDPGEDALAIKSLAAVVPQENNLDEELNVEQNLQVYARFYGLGTRAARRRIGELLEFVELNDRPTLAIRELSGGMKRRLIIARALLNRPSLLILDEPTTGLDPQVRHLIWDKLRQLKREGITILLTTHYMEEAYQICERVLIMHQGRKIMEGTPAGLLAQHIEKYVLELLSSEAWGRLPDPLPAGVRQEGTAERVLLYTDDLALLRSLAEQGSREYYLRQTNLEDLFMKATGRGLNE